jgi:hypothetical protein
MPGRESLRSRDRRSSDAQPPPISIATVDVVGTSDRGGTQEPGDGNDQPLPEGTTSSGRVVKPVDEAKPATKRARGAEVAYNFDTVIEPSPRFQQLVAESVTAKNHQELIAAEMKMWNLRHRYSEVGSKSRHSLKGDRLLRFADMKLGNPEKDSDIKPTENRELKAVPEAQTFDTDNGGRLQNIGSEENGYVMGASLLGIVLFDTLQSDILLTAGENSPHLNTPNSRR